VQARDQACDKCSSGGIDGSKFHNLGDGFARKGHLLDRMMRSDDEPCGPGRNMQEARRDNPHPQA